MTRPDPQGLLSAIAALEAAAIATKAARPHLDPAASTGFDHESLAAQIMADLQAGYEARMDAHVRENVIGDIENWRPTGLFQPCSTEAEAGQA